MGEFTIRDLGGMYTGDKPTKKNYKGEYKPDSFWGEYGNHYLHLLTGSKKSLEIDVQPLIARLHAIGAENILEVGCGFGRNFPFIKENVKCVKKVMGVEFSKAMIDSSAKYFKSFPGRDYRTEIIQGNAKNLPFEDDSFDLVYTHVCLTHIPPEDIPKVTSEISRVAKNWILHLERFHFLYEHPTQHRWSHCLPPLYQKLGWKLWEYDYINKKNYTCSVVFRK
jgi:SAM-dependent methyltransferase